MKKTFRGSTKTTWVSQDGEKIPVVRMHDSHLLNALRLIERSAGELVAKGAKIEDVARALDEKVPCYALMAKERQRRGLDSK